MGETSARSNPAALPPLQYLDIIVAQVGTGDEARSFTIHVSIITKRSAFFAAASSDRWISSCTRHGVVELPDEDALIFDLYLHCVYNNAVDIGVADRCLYITDEREKAILGFSEDASPGIRFVERFRRAVRLYVLPDKLGDCKTAKMAMDFMINSTIENRMPSDAFTMKFMADISNSAPGSPVRALCIRALIHDYSPVGLRNAGIDMLPQDLLVEAFYGVSEILATAREKPVAQGFNTFVIHGQRKRYYQYDALHPRPVGNDEAEEGESAATRAGSAGNS